MLNQVDPLGVAQLIMNNLYLYMLFFAQIDIFGIAVELFNKLSYLILFIFVRNVWMLFLCWPTQNKSKNQTQMKTTKTNECKTARQMFMNIVVVDLHFNFWTHYYYINIVFDFQLKTKIWIFVVSIFSRRLVHFCDLIDIHFFHSLRSFSLRSIFFMWKFKNKLLIHSAFCKSDE